MSSIQVLGKNMGNINDRDIGLVKLKQQRNCILTIMKLNKFNRWHPQIDAMLKEWKYMDINVFYFLRVIMAGHQKRKEILTYPPLGIREPQAWSEEFWKKKKKLLRKEHKTWGILSLLIQEIHTKSKFFLQFYFPWRFPKSNKGWFLIYYIVKKKEGKHHMSYYYATRSWELWTNIERSIMQYSKATLIVEWHLFQFGIQVEWFTIILISVV